MNTKLLLAIFMVLAVGGCGDKGEEAASGAGSTVTDDTREMAGDAETGMAADADAMSGEVLDAESELAAEIADEASDAAEDAGDIAGEVAEAVGETSGEMQELAEDAVEDATAALESAGGEAADVAGNHQAP